jgi:hypothetical protein
MMNILEDESVTAKLEILFAFIVRILLRFKIIIIFLSLLGLGIHLLLELGLLLLLGVGLLSPQVCFSVNIGGSSM